MTSKAKGKSSGTSNIKKMAALWGFTILSYDDIIFNLQDSCSNITKKANFKEVKLGHSSITKLRPPFIKIEGRNRKYRPQFKEFSRFPVLNFESTLGSCPFDDNEQGHWPGGGKVKRIASSKYCECCEVHFILQLKNILKQRSTKSLLPMTVITITLMHLLKEVV